MQRHKGLVTAMFITFLSCALHPGSGACAPATTGAAAQSRWLKALQNSAGQVGVEVVSLPDGKTLFAHQAHVALTPASLAKIVTCYVALRKLGPYYRFRTTVYASRLPEDGVIKGNIWIKGGGDPYLTLEKAYRLAHQIKQCAVRAIDGGIYIDNSYFHPPQEKICPNGQCDRSYNPMLAATSIDFNTFTVKLMSGGKSGSPVHVEILPPGDYVLLDMQATTMNQEPGANGTVHIQATGQTVDGREKYQISGHLPVNLAQDHELRQSVGNPAGFVARTIKTLLGQVGVEVRGASIGAGAVPADAKQLVEYESPPLADMLYGLNRYSNNFMAEMLLRTLGAVVAGAPGSEAKGTAVLRSTLREMGLAADEVALEGGSGLNRTSRISAHALCGVLGAAYRDFSLAPELMASLAAGGQEGTLHKRLQDAPDKMLVRGKTGSLRDVVGFAGYVGTPGNRVYAVTILLNKVYKPGDARKAIDAFLISVPDLAGNQ